MIFKKKYGLALLLAVIVAALSYYIFYDIPNYDRETILTIPQSSIITDREGNELFRFFDEDRRRVSFNEIAPHMVNAMIATEDKSFWDNPGIDTKAILRATKNNLALLWENGTNLQGGSTLTQQLVKNIFLNNEKTLKRKLQESILAITLTQQEQKQTKKDYPELSRAERHQKSKESIISMYLNYVFFGNQSYGIESASQNFFLKKAQDLSLVESSILASLPQAPSLYNPIVDTQKVVGHRYVISGAQHTIYDVANSVQTLSGLFQALPQQQEYNASLTCLDNIRQRGINKKDGFPSTALYMPGRKDHVLCQLYQQGYNTREEIYQAWLDAHKVVFHKARLPINAPHFVFWVRQKAVELPQVKQAGIDSSNLIRQGYTIQTTLSQQHQTAAEAAVTNFMGYLQKNGGNNRALLHINSTDGSVLSYVGSQDFHNREIEGQNDIIQAVKQVGSTIKPFIYTYLFTHFQRDRHNTIGDYPIESGPSNHDNIFWGHTSIGRALAGSRNLPVVRVYLALGGDNIFVPYLRQLGFLQLDTQKEYNYPLALGAGEHTMLELADAYGQLSSTGDTHRTINPILSITDPHGEIIYRKDKHHQSMQKIIPDSVAQIIREILSSQDLMPQSWWPRRILPLKHIAIKTGTTDKKIGNSSVPRDAWMVLYTPQDVIVGWAGNTNGQAMGPKAYGGDMNYYVLKQYLESLTSQGLIQDKEREGTTEHNFTRQEPSDAILKLLRGN